MTKLVVLLFVLLLPLVTTAVIVNNSSTSPTSEDSLAVVFYSLDSIGNPTTADSVFLLVCDPSGSVVYTDSVLLPDSRVTSTIIRGKQFYTYHEQVSQIDGNGIEGWYTLTLLAKNNTYDLLTPIIYPFQIIADEFSDKIALIDDSVFVKGGVVDSNRTEQGGGSDSVSIARWVWNTPQGNHTKPGTFGKYLDTEVSGVSGGTGAYAVQVVMYDSIKYQPVPQVTVAVRNIMQDALLAIGKTGSDGTVSFNLDADSFVIVPAAAGYLFDTFDTIVVAGAEVDTIYGSQFDPGTPSSPSLCRVWGYIYTFYGEPEVNATVTAHLPGGVVTYNSAIISPFAVSTQTDSTGYFALDLTPSELLVPGDAKYEITITRSDGTFLRQRVTVPNQGSWQLTW